MEAIHQKGNLNPLNLFPEEVWRKVLANLLDDPPSVISAGQTCTLFQSLLEGSHESARLAEVFPFLVKHLDLGDILKARRLSKCNQLSLDRVIENSHLITEYENRRTWATPNYPPNHPPNYDHLHLGSLSRVVGANICGLTALDRLEMELNNPMWRKIRKMSTVGNSLSLYLNVKEEEDEEAEGIEEVGSEDESEGEGGDHDGFEDVEANVGVGWEDDDNDGLNENEGRQGVVVDMDENPLQKFNRSMDDYISLERGVKLITTFRNISILYLTTSCDDNILIASHSDVYLLFKSLLVSAPFMRKMELILLQCKITEFEVNREELKQLQLQTATSPLPDANFLESLCIRYYFMPIPFLLEIHRCYGRRLKWIELAQGSNFISDSEDPIGQLQFDKLTGAKLVFHSETFPKGNPMNISAPNLLSLDLQYTSYTPRLVQSINYFWSHCFRTLPTFRRLVEVKLTMQMDHLTLDSVVVRTTFPAVKYLHVNAWNNQLPIKTWTLLFPNLERFSFRQENEEANNCEEWERELYLIGKSRGHELDLWKSAKLNKFVFYDPIGGSYRFLRE